MHDAAAAINAKPDRLSEKLTSRPGTLFNKLLILIPLGVIGNVLFVACTTDRSLYEGAFHFALRYLLLAIVLGITPWFTGSLRLMLWSRFMKYRLRYRDVFRIVLGAELGAAITPPLIGGSAVKTALFMQHGLAGSAAVSLTMFEGLADALFFFIMTPLAITLSSSWGLPAIHGILSGISHPSPWMLLGGSGVIFAIILVSVLRRRRNRVLQIVGVSRLGNKIRSLYRNVVLIWKTILIKGKSVFALTFTLTALQWTCRYSVITLLLMSLGLPVQPILYMALQVLVFALTAFVPTPGGAGGAEAAFFFFYRPFLPAEFIGVVTIGWRMMMFYVHLLVAAILFLVFHRSANNDVEEQL